MSEENLEVVRAIYDAWANGQLGRRYMSKDVEYVNPPQALELGTRTGAASFNNVFEVYEQIAIDIDELIDAGNKVVMVGRMRGRARATGIELDRPHSQVWTLEGGRATRMEWFHDAAEAREAAGLR